MNKCFIKKNAHSRGFNIFLDLTQIMFEFRFEITLDSKLKSGTHRNSSINPFITITSEQMFFKIVVNFEFQV